MSLYIPGHVNAMSVVHQPISTTIHEPSRFFTSQGDPYKEHALLILNQPISSKALLQRLWSCTSYRICADGGANRLYDLFDKHEDLAERDMYVCPPVNIPRFPAHSSYFPRAQQSFA